uniref:Uncharacterized protein LOC104249075 n=1 Tax=Nicotiana sylvestris TaxID=4096 RepID=A0A1U7YKV4_NICSY|nr:PREDICTED: uncharacterized protein LOC104249075 [Nicotiana sylvestris]
MVNLTECQEKIQKDPRNAELIEEKIRLMKESIKWKAAKEQFLRQKSKILWVRQGGQNTKYFHSVLKTRRNANRIFSIKDAEGKESTDVEGITNAFIKFYKKLLGKEKETGDKSPGPDGYRSRLLKDCWPMVRQDVIGSVMEFFDTTKMLRIINRTTLTLIPTNNHAAEAGDYRPIACCNTVYKIISKVLYNRIKGVLPSIITENQNAFVKGRSGLLTAEIDLYSRTLQVGT